MKIQKLTIENIASIEHAVIDFDSEPLSSDPIFLITGDTGTGKSTILNAICLALYDQVPAFETFSVDKQEKDSDNISPRDSTQLMRKGVDRARVELCFIGNDDRPYISRWDAHRIKKRKENNEKKLASELSLFDVQKNENLIKGVKAAILSVVGLTFDQFIRTTMLAQGQFATFMKAKDEDKSTILEKLTGTEIYSIIGRKVYDRYDKKSKEYSTCEATIKGAKLLTDEDKKKYTDEIETLEAKRIELDALIKSINERLDWLTKIDDIDKKIAKAADELEKARTLADSEENRAHQTTVAQWYATAEPRRNLTDEHDSADRITDLIAQLKQLSGTRWQTILNGMAWVRDHTDQVSRTLQELLAQQEQILPIADVLDQATRISTTSANIEDYLSEADTLRKSSEKKSGKAKTSSEAEKVLIKEQKEAEEGAAETEREIMTKKERLTKIDQSALRSKSKALKAKKTALEDAKHAVAKYITSLTTKANREKELEEAKQKLAKIVRELQEAEAYREEAEKADNEAHAIFEGQKQLKDHITQMRRTFADTGECPLCGSAVTHLHTDEIIESKLAETKDAAEKAHKKHQEAETAVKDLKVDKQVQEAEVKRANKLYNDSIIDLHNAEEDAKDKETRYKETDCIDTLDREIEAIDNEIKKVDRLNDEAADIQAQIDILSDKLIKQNKKISGIKDRLGEQQKATAIYTTQAETEAVQAENQSKKAEDAMSELRGILFTGDQKHDTLLRRAINTDDISVENIKKVAEKINSLNEEYKDLSHRIISEQTDLSNSHSLLEDCKLALSSIQKPAGLHDTGASCPSPSELFVDDGTATATERKELLNDIHQLGNLVSSLYGKIESEVATLKSARKYIDDWLAESSYTRDDLADLSKLSKQKIDEWKEEDERIQQQLRDTNNTVKILSDQKKDLEKKRPKLQEGDTIELLKAASEESTNAYTSLISKKGELHGILNDDTRRAQQLEEEQTRLKKLSKELKDWQDLNTAFGNQSGSRLKKIAQSYILRILLLRTNEYLRMLSPRYRLDCEDGSLMINVIDSYQGDAVRNVGLLSGGEGFVISLALALGLASISKTKINVDTLFIDEGFGTLDKETLDTVITVLDRLHSLGGRRIGIISHVQDLKERIPTQIRLVRTGPSSSRVVVTTL